PCAVCMLVSRDLRDAQGWSARRAVRVFCAVCFFCDLRDAQGWFSEMKLA
ncbi:hypothetical protein A2U01_0063010, partial [Trifolium medium]|nr:hypothetical protein [Trifolium medium]